MRPEGLVGVDGRDLDGELLDHYYEALSGALVENGVALSVEEVAESVYPRATLQDQYETGLLDMARIGESCTYMG